MTEAKAYDNTKGLGYEIFMGLLAIVSICNMIFLHLPWGSLASDQAISIIQAFLTMFFLFDFFYRFTTTKSKRYYFLHDWGWADLLSCWPGSAFRILRIFRLAKVVRLIKNYGFKNLLREINDNRPAMAIYLVIFLVLVILEFGAVWVIKFESQNPNANIKTGGDAIWWGYVTMTTIGYGDRYPITPGGRMVGAILMTCGVGIFSVFTGFIANSFLAPRKKEKEAKVEPSDPKIKIAEMKKLLEEQDKASSDLKSRLEEIEKMFD